MHTGATASIELRKRFQCDICRKLHPRKKLPFYNWQELRDHKRKAHSY